MSVTSPRLPALLSLLAILAMVATLSWQGYSFWQMEQKARTDAGATSQVTTPESREPEVDLSSIDLFGTADQSAVAQAVDTENLPETNLRLFLRGVLAADGDFPGSALVEDDKGKTEAYLVGDELPGNAKLRSVHPRRVIIERAGKLENLYFPETEDRSGMDVADSNDSPGDDTATPSVTPAASGGGVTIPATPAADEQRREEIRRRLEQLRERLRNNSN